MYRQSVRRVEISQSRRKARPDKRKHSPTYVIHSRLSHDAGNHLPPPPPSSSSSSSSCCSCRCCPSIYLSIYLSGSDGWATYNDTVIPVDGALSSGPWKGWEGRGDVFR